MIAMKMAPPRIAESSAVPRRARTPRVCNLENLLTKPARCGRCPQDLSGQFRRAPEKDLAESFGVTGAFEDAGQCPEPRPRALAE